MIYLTKIANDTKEPLCDETVRDLVAIVNDVVTYINDNQERVMHHYTIWDLVDILDTFPIESLERQHIVFLSRALQWGPPLIIRDKIEQKFLPKLLKAKARQLTLVFLEVMLNDRDMISVMKKQGSAILKLCGIEAVRVALEHIQGMISQNASSFQVIQPIESNSESLISFTSGLFRLAKPDSVVKAVENLLQKSHTVFKQIALNAIKHHYNSLKHLFWQWQGNPLEDVLLKP